MSKAENRFQEYKHKEKIKRMIKDIWHDPALANDKTFVGIEAGVHGKRCSCPMCCNARRSGFNKSEKLTKDEIYSIEDLNDFDE